MINKEDYLTKLLAEIASAKAHHRNGVFKISEKIPDNVATYARDFLIANTPYRVEFIKCRGCLRTWDIVIIF